MRHVDRVLGVWLQSCGMHDEDAPVSSMKLSLGHVM